MLKMTQTVILTQLIGKGIVDKGCWSQIPLIIEFTILIEFFLLFTLFSLKIVVF